MLFNKIVVLDGYTLNPGDLDWSCVSSLADNFSLYDRTAENDIFSHAAGADVLLTNKTPLTAAMLARLPSLKYIGVLATGTNVVDLAAAAAAGICVTNVPGYGPDAVAQMVFAHILHHTQRLALHDEAVRSGHWQTQQDFCFTLAPLMSLKGKMLGLVGFGNIGRQVARIGTAFDMRLLVHTPNQPDLQDFPSATWTTLDAIIGESDVLSLHCPLTPQTDQMINAQSLKRMKSGALLINTARGGLVDEAALAAALQAGKLRAGLDVLSSEPPTPDNPLLGAPNLSLTPHNAWATREARQKLLHIATANLQAFGEGQIINRIN
ncbi:MAG: D-2-hydroxyacid dehydrogenase [Shewanella sp.]|nr:D-2-hydroxyacid dehydrogenase [Shewanella sp.]MCF1430467.1 D-2-hydroxyacid dehydrogenase [Shewanella sp.]MCF1438283.1 D-2-hydroxyacid dehydrogenase [Shewanella sp.]MCF1458144.1 D-2-hydroxyacid dehydrogenase [Shewanella sp.]